MNTVTVIPQSHWDAMGTSGDPALYIPSWEKQLRARISAQPDPERRFNDWLTSGATSSPDLTFLEHPYVDWARKVWTIKAEAKKQERASLGAEIASVVAEDYSAFR